MGLPPLKPFMTRTEFAAHIGVAKSYVTKLGHQGRVVMGQGDNAERIDVAATKALLADTTGAPARAAVVTPAFGDAREAREHYQAEMARLDYEERCGRLLPADQVRSLVASAATALRTRLEMLPDTLAPRLAATADESQVRAVLAGEIEAALAELAHQLGKVAAPQGVH